MDKIVCLVGESASGKSTIAELLEKDGYNYIQSYTTRKPRYEGEKGHIFVETINWTFEFEKNTIAYTLFDDNYYWATKEQYQGKGTSIYVIDPAGIKELKEKVKDVEIVVIYLKCDRENRFVRMCHRDKYEKVRQRINHDKEAFKIVPCDYAVDANRTIEEILEDIKSLI